MILPRGLHLVDGQRFDGRGTALGGDTKRLVVHVQHHAHRHVDAAGVAEDLDRHAIHQDLELHAAVRSGSGACLSRQLNVWAAASYTIFSPRTSNTTCLASPGSITAWMCISSLPLPANGFTSPDRGPFSNVASPAVQQCDFLHGVGK